MRARRALLVRNPTLSFQRVPPMEAFPTKKRAIHEAGGVVKDKYFRVVKNPHGAGFLVLSREKVGGSYAVYGHHQSRNVRDVSNLKTITNPSQHSHKTRKFASRGLLSRYW